jgi:hypothetical protein
LAHEFFQYDMEAPKPCVSLTANLLRDRNDVISDLVELSWVKDSVSPGTGVEIFVTDFVGKKHSVYTSDGAALSVRLENISRFIVQDEGPAVARPYRFHIVATNLSAKSSETYAAPINITSRSSRWCRRPRTRSRARRAMWSMPSSRRKCSPTC